MSKKRAFEISPLPLEVQTALHTLGAQLARTGEERGYSQRHFSGIAEMSLPTVVKMEQGANRTNRLLRTRSLAA